MDRPRVRTTKQFLTRISKVSLICIATFCTGIALYAALYQGEVINKDTVTFVKVEEVERAPSVRGFGNFVPRSKELLVAPVGSYIKAVNAQVGSRYMQGDLLLTLTREPALKVLDEKTSLRRQIKARVNEKRGEQKLNAIESKYAIAVLEGQLKVDRQELTANEVLLSKGIVSQISVDRSRSKISASEARLTAEIEKFKVQTSIADEQIEYLEGNLAVAKKSQSEAKSVLASMNVRAPFDGVIEESFATVGQKVSDGDRLVLFAYSDQLLAKISIPQNEASRVEVGDEALLNVQDVSVNGVLQRVGSTVKNGAVTVSVLPIDNLPEGVRINQSVTGIIYPKKNQFGIYVKRSDELHPYEVIDAFIVTKPGECEKRRLKLGGEIDGFVEVIDGASKSEVLCLGIPQKRKSDVRVSY